MYLAMISQPMNGLSDEEIKTTKEKAERTLESLGYTVINTLRETFRRDQLKMEGVNVPLMYLAKSLGGMAKVQAVYFCKGYENARGCKIEHDVAKAYGLELIYEED